MPTIMKRKFIRIIALIIFFIILPQLLNSDVCFGLKNPFISPFKVKQYKNFSENPLNGLNLQAIVSGSEPDKNIAIINGNPYYAGSKIMEKTVVGITRQAVIIKLKNGKIVKLILSKFEGFKK